MGFRTSMATNVTPLLLRVALGVTFLWAGWGKVFVTQDYQPAQAAMLANMGVSGAMARATGATGAPLAPAAPPREPRRDPPDAPSQPLPEPGENAATTPARPDAVSIGRVTLVRNSDDEAPAPPRRTYRAEDFDGPIELAGLYNLALLLTAVSDRGDDRMPLWPPVMAEGSWPVRWAWAAALTELIAGGLVLIGFMTRLSAFSLAGVMGVAMWLTQIGPRIGAEEAFLWVLPPLRDFSPETWRTLLWQFMLLCAALGVFFSGPGCLSLDRFVFGSSKRGSPPKTNAPPPRAT